VGCKGGAEIAVEIRAERSSPRIESGTNCRGSVGHWGGFPRHLFLAGAVAAFWGTMESIVPQNAVHPTADEQHYAHITHL